MKRWAAVAILLLVAQILFAWPDPGTFPGRGFPAWGFANGSFARYGGGAPPATEPGIWTSRFVPLFFSAIFILLSLIAGVDIHNGIVLRRILTAVEKNREYSAIAAAQTDVERYLVEPPRGEKKIGGPDELA